MRAFTCNAVAAIALALALSGCGSKPGQIEKQATPVTDIQKPATLTTEQDAVQKILSQQFNVAPSQILMDQPITVPPLSADDLDLVEIVMELDDRFGIMIPDDAVPVVNETSRITPNQLVSIVLEAQKKKRTTPD